ncbi:MAG: thioredoxin [Xanthomonadaceae bacterium]|nr:thioredoxin [Xanthomonadaceae bacterium]
MKVLNETEFKSQIFDYTKKQDWKFEGSLPTIVDFYADWCGPCRALTPILEELSQEYAGKVSIVKIDTESSPELAGAFGIQSIPSILFIPLAGKPSMAMGLVPKESLKQAIKEVLGVSV